MTGRDHPLRDIDLWAVRDELKKKNIEDLYRDTSGWVRTNPGKTLMGALATGFVLGWLLRRR